MRIESTGGDERRFYILPNDTPVCRLECKQAFDQLTDDERRYAYHLTRASWLGSFIVQLQTSIEAPAIGFLLRALAGCGVDELKRAAVDVAGFSEQEWQSFLVYFAGFWHNQGNYKGFGDTKFVPDFDEAKFTKFVRATDAYKNDGTTIDALLAEYGGKIFSLGPKDKELGFPAVATTTYLAASITKEDADAAKAYMKSIQMEAWNTRLLRSSEGHLEIRLASIETGVVRAPTDYNGRTFVVTRGDYSELLARIVPELEAAARYAANENQRGMLAKYVEHCRTGSLDAHKDGSRFWIKDIGPAVESYIGFIENYRDPAGVRSEFEGFVAAVDKVTSVKFQRLVDMAEPLLQLLPWDALYEKEKFHRPDFTSLNVLAFASSGPPAGINIPNYDEIRQQDGFKNVSLGNVIASIPKRPVSFLSLEDQALYKEHYTNAFEVQVGLHELLGHGSGRLLQRIDANTFNFDRAKLCDLNGVPIVNGGFYEVGETFGSVFGHLQSAYEECRAEAVGYMLCCYDQVMKVFEWEGAAADTVRYVNWLSEMRAGLIGLEMYTPEKHMWGQAHSHARFVLLRVALEAGEDFVRIDETTNADDGKPDLLVTVDKSKVCTVGKRAIAEFLKKLQFYKSTADSKGAHELFAKYGTVDEHWTKMRNIVVTRRQPRRLMVQPNLVLKHDKIELAEYDATLEHVVLSVANRFEHDAAAAADALTIARRDKHQFV